MILNNQYKNINEELLTKELKRAYNPKSQKKLLGDFIELDSSLSIVRNRKEITINDLFRQINFIKEQDKIHYNSYFKDEIYIQFKYAQKYPNNKILVEYLDSKIRNSTLNFLFYILANEHGWPIKKYHLIRNSGESCDNINFIYSTRTSIPKIVINGYSTISEHSDSFTIPKYSKSELKDSLQISILDLYKGKFIPAEIHFLN